MKTVTNYAEKKAKQFLNLLQGYTKGIRITAILILLLMGVNSAWGADVQKDAIIYFDNSASQWSYAYHYFAINESYGYKMTKVNNTLLYVHKRTDNTWGGYSSIRLFATTSSWGDPTASGLGGYNNMKSYGANITNTYNNYGFNANNYYYIKPDKKGSTSSHANISVGYLGNSSSSLNKTITVKAKVSTDGGSTYGEATSPGTLSASSYKFTEYNSCASATSLSSGTITCGYTANTTLTAADATGYTFVGWYNSSGTQQTTGKTLSINPTAATTYYAYYKKNQHTVKFGVHSSGNGTLTAKVGNTSITSGNKVNYGSEVVFTATPSAGYQIEGWYSNSSCTTSLNNGTNNTYTISNLTADKTVYVKFEEIPANTHTITYTAQATGWTYGTQPTSAEEGAQVTFEVIPTTGYTVTVTSDDVTLNKNENEYTFTMPTKDVAINVSATENTHDVTISYKSGGVILQADATISVSEANATSIEAPAVSGYAFTGWTLGTGITNKSANTTTNPISITTKASGEYTLTANYEKERCVYFVNTARWTTIKAYAWNDSGNNGWPGANMTKESEKISGYDVYKYVMPAGKNYDKLVFNQGNDDGKTGDLEWVDGKYYVYSAGQWVDKNEVADLLPKPVIYFKNNPGWKNVYVYFLTEEKWDASKGSSSKGLTEANKRVCKMEKVGETDIYKYDYEASGIVPGNVIAFTEAKQPNYDNFHKTQAVYRTDYNPNMELFIPQATYETKNETKYFNKGLWMKYNSMESGYTITGSMNSWNQDDDKFTSSSHTGYHFDIELSLGGGQTYQFQVKNIKNDWYGKQNTTITATKADLELGISAGDTYNVKLTTTSAGNYIFSIDLSEGKMMVSVEYPLQVNDYRLVYVESEVSGKTPYTKFHPAQSIHYQATGGKKDTVSFYINKTTGKNPAILLQQCTNISGANITWKDVAIQNINGNGGATPTAALAPAKRAGELYVGGGADITTNGVYNFTLSQTDGTAKILNEETHPYEGDYYIRTDAADGGWRKYNTNPDNIMTHSQTALKHGGYDYYFCKWALENTNVHYVVANKYSYCVSDTLKNGDFTNNEGKIPHNANVRYTWNSSTNEMSRAYINGSGDVKDRYLILEGDANIKDIEGHTFNITGLNANEANFKDMGNWLYQLEVKANSNAKVKLTANYNDTKQYFKGGAGAEEKVSLITGATKDYKLRLVYDFKTNYLISALIDDTEIDEDLELDEVMIIRSHHDDANTIQVAKSKGSVTAIQTIYGVMTFNKTTLNDNTKSQYERALYWVSFPFDVDLGEAFGFGNYGEHWIMEYYDGEERAKNGAWVDSDTYWRYITNPKGYKLKAGEGYVLCLDLDLLQNDASVFHHSDEIALYFPSLQHDLVIANAPTTNTTNVTAHTCEINRPTPDGDRRIKDSNWNIIGIPCYSDIDNSTIGKLGLGNLQFLYQYNADNTYTAQAATNFNTMHAYMVQYAGDIYWINLYVDPAQMAARRNAAGKDQYTLRLALQQEGTDHDHTFIRLQEDKATAEFDMNYDLCKIINRGANIYSMINNVEVAANVLPVEERVIPIGLDIHETGNYTFAMPDGTDGITAILIDYETGKETNLLLADYTTELREGTNNGRFALRVRPNHVATAVETIIDGANGQIQKYIINGALYILNNGQLYDAQGRMVQP